MVDREFRDVNARPGDELDYEQLLYRAIARCQKALADPSGETDYSRAIESLHDVTVVHHDEQFEEEYGNLREAYEGRLEEIRKAESSAGLDYSGQSGLGRGEAARAKRDAKYEFKREVFRALMRLIQRKGLLGSADSTAYE